jgi:hypothetical protein
MLKTTIIAIMLFMVSLSAGARNSLMTHAQFVHLSSEEKDKYVIKLMELSVELESRYKHETAQYGYSEERFQRYSKVLNSLRSLFLVDSAYAASMGKIPNITWEKMATEFNTLINTKQTTNGSQQDDTCIFAGWVSRVIFVEGKPTCTHPDFIDGSGPNRHATRMAPESRGYPYPTANSDCRKDDKKMIQCNPVIFGYQEISSKTPFCVEAKDGAKNSSFMCMQSALNDETRPKTDSKDVRLKYIREKLANTPNVFNQVWEFTYKTCVCPTVQANRTGGRVTFSQAYQNHVRPHRTCYGLMEMMAATALECTSEHQFPLKDDQVSIFSSLQSTIKRKTGSSMIEETAADQQYTAFLNGLNENKTAEYVRICGGQVTTPREEEPTEIPEVVVTARAPVYACTSTCEEKAAVPASGDTPATPAGISCGEITITKKIGDADAETVPADKFETAPVLVSRPANKEQNSVKVKFKIKEQTAEKEIDCALTFKEPEVPKEEPTVIKEPKLTLTIDACPGDTCKVKAEKTDADDWKIVWEVKAEQGLTVPEKPADDATEMTAPKKEKQYQVCAELQKGEEKKGNDCKNITAKTAPTPTAPRPAAAPMNYNGAGPQAPQVPMRGTTDTSAVGIK